MPHSFTKIWIHAIWGTKDRHPFIIPAVEKKIHEKLGIEFIESGSPVRIINGMPDHVHSLVLLNPQKALSDTIKQVKGSTSHWINEQNVIKEKFSWQSGFGAYSVSESALEKVYLYIANQKQHHSKKSFLQEYEEFIKMHGLFKE